MSLRCSKRARAVRLAILVLLGAVSSHRAEAGTLSVCVDRASPTAMLDARLAHAALGGEGWRVRVVPYVGIGRGGDGFPVRRFAKMAQSDCALIMGFPVDATAAHLPPDVRATAPYADTGFVLAAPPAEVPATLDGLRAGSEIGIADLDTVAGLALAAHPRLTMHVYPDNDAMLAALARGRIAAALVWQPDLADYERRHPHVRLGFRRLHEAHLGWRLVALYAPQAEFAARRFERGMEALRADGRLADLIAPYGLPCVPAAAARNAGAVAPPRGSLMAVRELRRTHRVARVPALFTAEQATRGAQAYAEHCAACHGDALEGRTGPALKGPDFADPASDFHVGDIFGFISRMMPAMSPGSLDHDTYVAIMAYLLQQNGYPAGQQALTYDTALQSRVPLVYHEPETAGIAGHGAPGRPGPRAVAQTE